jgi:hypothetical protein
MAKNSNKHYTQEELEQLRKLYIEENLSVEQCASILRRPVHGIKAKIKENKWSDIKQTFQESMQLADSRARQLSKKTEGLTEEFLTDLARRSAAATSTAFDHFEEQANAGDLYKMETAIKIADRASNIARKAMGLDGPGASKPGSVTFNVYYAADAPVRKVKKVEPDDDNSDNSDASVDI